MTFDELEKIRIKYYEKQKAIRTKVLTVLGVIYFCVYVLSVIIAFTSDTSRGLSVFITALFAFLPIVLHLIVIAIIAIVVATSLSTKNEATEYRNAYKNYFITGTFQRVFTNISYSHSAEMPYTIPASTNMLIMGDRYSSNDYTIAKYKGIGFQQADVHIEEKHTDSDGDTTYITIFRGRYVVFDLSKKFEKKLCVASKSFFADKHDSSFKKIELESIEFNKKFDIYAQDGFEAYYLLDPAVMERIVKLNELHKSSIMVCFSDNKMHIAINNHLDSFEPAPINKPIDEKAEFDKVMNDIKVITNIVDELRLVK